MNPIAAIPHHLQAWAQQGQGPCLFPSVTTTAMCSKMNVHVHVHEEAESNLPQAHYKKNFAAALGGIHGGHSRPGMLTGRTTVAH